MNKPKLKPTPKQKPGSKANRTIAVGITLALFFSVFGTVQGVFADKKPGTSLTMEQLSSQEQAIVAEISNLTGVKTEEIIKLKTTSNTWNDVLSELKAASGENNQEAAAVRSSLLAETDLEVEFVQKLRDEGYSDTKITEAKSLVDRVRAQLKQILENQQDQWSTPANGVNPLNPLPPTATSEQNEPTGSAGQTKPNSPTPTLQDSQVEAGNEDLEAYQELAAKIDLQTAVELLLKLEQDLGSLEKVLDEYLLSLQISLDLKLRLSDKEAYTQAKSEQLTKVELEKIITLADIEAKVLALLQNRQLSNTLSMPQPEANQPAKSTQLLPGSQDETPFSPLPEVQSSRPPHPQADLMQEINELTNKSLIR